MNDLHRGFKEWISLHSWDKIWNYFLVNFNAEFFLTFVGNFYHIRRRVFISGSEIHQNSVDSIFYLKNGKKLPFLTFCVLHMNEIRFDWIFFDYSKPSNELLLYNHRDKFYYITEPLILSDMKCDLKHWYTTYSISSSTRRHTFSRSTDVIKLNYYTFNHVYWNITIEQSPAARQKPLQFHNKIVIFNMKFPVYYFNQTNLYHVCVSISNLIVLGESKSIIILEYGWNRKPKPWRVWAETNKLKEFSNSISIRRKCVMTQRQSSENHAIEIISFYSTFAAQKCAKTEKTCCYLSSNERANACEWLSE